ncbi:substrate-binding periplasmic protein [Maridesulfovibrio sp. FT414]|uniref:substrate-binding periplasmic protein n=1 Tax=Maridesulfovibrio sp. FT414 TaxID=2979469 RepID=UPI003D8069F9
MPFKTILCSVLLLLLASSPAQGRKEILTVSGQMDWKPFLMKHQHTEEFYGAMYEILKQASEANGYELDYRDYPWKRAVVSLEKGRLDVICGMFWNPQRGPKYNFSAPIIRNQLRIFTTKPFRMDSLSDLIGRKGDIIRGGSYGETFDTFIRCGKADFTEVTDDNTALNRLVRGYSDFFIGTYIDTMLKISERNLMDTIVPLPYIVDNVDVYFAFARHSRNKPAYEEIKLTLERMQQNGTIRSILEKYFQGTGISPETVLIGQ